MKWAGHVERMGDEKLTGIRNPERGRKKERIGKSTRLATYLPKISCRMF